MKYVLGFLFSLNMAACADYKCTISKVTVSFYRENRSLDSVIIKDKQEIEIIEKYLAGKTEIADKFPAKYYLGINYSNGEYVEYLGNGQGLRDKKTYINPNKNIQNSYLKIINAKIPAYLQQK